MTDPSGKGAYNPAVRLISRDQPPSGVVSPRVRLPEEQTLMEYTTKLSLHIAIILNDPLDEIEVYKYSSDFEIDGDDHNYRISKVDIHYVYQNEWPQFITSSDILDTTGTSMIQELKRAIDLDTNSKETTNLLLISLYIYLRDCKTHSDYIKGGRYYVDTSQCGHTVCRVINFGVITFMHQSDTYDIIVPPLCKFCRTRTCLEEDWEEGRAEFNTRFLIDNPELTPSDLKRFKGSTFCIWPEGNAPPDQRTLLLQGHTGDKSRFFKFVATRRGTQFRLIRSYTTGQFLQMI